MLLFVNINSRIYYLLLELCTEHYNRLKYNIFDAFVLKIEGNKKIFTVKLTFLPNTTDVGKVNKSNI